MGWFEAQNLHTHGLAAHLSVQAGWLPARVLFVAAGVGEELFFRGLLQPVAEAALGAWPGIAVAAAIWTILHIVWNRPLDLAYLFLVGLFWGWVRDQTRSLWASATAHGLINLLVFIVLPLEPHL